MKNQLSWQIIKRFSSKNTLGFTYQDVLSEFQERSPIYLARVLSEMVKKGMLRRIARDNYHIVPVDANPEKYVPEAALMGKYFMQDREYYIGYASAMSVHGLKPGEEGLEYVVTRKQMKPSTRVLGESRFQFIMHDDKRFFGFKPTWIN